MDDMFLLICNGTFSTTLGVLITQVCIKTNTFDAPF